MRIFLEGAEMLLCMPIEIIIEDPNLEANIYWGHSVLYTLALGTL